MLARKPKTVDGVLTVFTKTLQDLREIVERNKQHEENFSAQIHELEKAQDDVRREKKRASEAIDKIAALIE